MNKILIILEILLIDFCHWYFHDIGNSSFNDSATFNEVDLTMDQADASSLFHYRCRVRSP